MVHGGSCESYCQHEKMFEASRPHTNKQLTLCLKLLSWILWLWKKTFLYFDILNIFVLVQLDPFMGSLGVTWERNPDFWPFSVILGCVFAVFGYLQWPTVFRSIFFYITHTIYEQKYFYLRWIVNFWLYWEIFGCFQ